jgi:plastocyanin
MRPNVPGGAAGPAPRAGRRRLLVALAGVVEPAWLDPAAAAAPARTHRVVIQGLLYRPETLDVRRGDTVVWVNDDPMPHTVTAAGEFDSRTIDAGKSWRFVARRAGTYPYVCTLHSNMHGSLKVE